MEQTKFKVGDILINTMKYSNSYGGIVLENAPMIRITKVEPWYYWEFFHAGSWINKENNTSIEIIEKAYVKATKAAQVLYGEK